MADSKLVEQLSSQTWNTMRHQLCKMRQDAVLCDLNIVGSDFDRHKKIIHTHSVLMTASCKFFHKLLVTCKSRLSPTEMHRFIDLDTETLQVVVDFIYGNAPHLQSDLKLLKRGADVLEINTAHDYLSQINFSQILTLSNSNDDLKVAKSNLTASLVQIKQDNSIKLLKKGGKVSQMDSERPAENSDATGDQLLTQTATNNGIMTCEHCSKIFWNEKLFKKHVSLCAKSATEPDPATVSLIHGYNDTAQYTAFGCRDCPKQFISAHLLVQHMKSAHRYKPTLSAMNDGNSVHIADRFDSANLCGTTNENDTDTADNTDMADDDPDHVLDDAPDHVSDDGTDSANEAQVTTNELLQNQRGDEHVTDLSLFTPNSKSRKCKMCWNSFNNAFHLLFHLEKLHVGCVYFMCCICGCDFYLVAQVLEHFSSEHGINVPYTHLRGLKAVLTHLNVSTIAKLSLALANSSFLKLDEWGYTWLQQYYLCPYCNQGFDSPESLTADIKIHLARERVKLNMFDQREHECQLCSEMFEDRKTFLKHVSTYHVEVLTCAGCSVKFADFEELHQHAQKHCQGQQVPRINVSTKLAMLSHKRSSKCVLCYQNFHGKIFSFLLHNFAQHPDKWQMCSLCGHQAPSNTSFMEKHFLVQHGISSTSHCLTFMRFVINTSNVTSIRSVWKALQNDPIQKFNDFASEWLTTSFLCGFCDCVFKSCQDLTSHVNDHLFNDYEFEVQVKRVKCDLCDETFPNKRALANHGMKAHGKGVSCRYCSKKFAGPSNLSIHERRHLTERQFVCELCNKSFNQRAHLQDHMRSHSDHKEFSCEHCGKQFKFKAGLNKHKQREHDPNYERQHTCDVCGVSTHTDAKLKLHRLTHSELKPYICQHCGKGFKTLKQCKRHMGIHGIRFAPGARGRPQTVSNTREDVTSQNEAQQMVLEDVQHKDISTAEYITDTYDVIEVLNASDQ